MAVILRAGTLRHRITIQRKTATRDDYGGESTTWEDFATNVAAEIRPLSSRELVAARGVQSETTHEITIRYRPGITAAMRAVYNGRIFNFAVPMNTEERNVELVISATEGLNKG